MTILADHPVTPWRLNWAKAAQGDHEAMRLLRAFYLDQYGKTANLDHLDLAECWARGSADQETSNHDDRLTLARILTMSAQRAPLGFEADICKAEAVGILSELADAGQEDAASIVNTAIADSGPGFAQLAKSLGAYWRNENVDLRAQV